MKHEELLWRQGARLLLFSGRGGCGRRHAARGGEARGRLCVQIHLLDMRATDKPYLPHVQAKRWLLHQ